MTCQQTSGAAALLNDMFGLNSCRVEIGVLFFFFFPSDAQSKLQRWLENLERREGGPDGHKEIKHALTYLLDSVP